MTATLKININQLDERFVQRLKEQFGDSTLEISIAPTSSVAPLTDEQFWEIINLLDWEKESKEDILRAALLHLSSNSIGAIYRFQDILCDKLYKLDGKKYAKQLGYGSDEYFSVDEFLYARACVVANGRETYEAVLKEEMEMPQNLAFEPLLYLAKNAYAQKTGKEFIHVPTHSYETFSNQSAWE